MREQIQTIPVNEAFDAHDECPFCNMERTVEQRTIRYVLGAGASYMEPDVRSATDRSGFCRSHYKKMFDYGNPLGNALMMQTYLNGLMMEFENQEKGFTPPAKKPLFGKKKPEPQNSSLADWLAAKDCSCLSCRSFFSRRHRMTFSRRCLRKTSSLRFLRMVCAACHRRSSFFRRCCCRSFFFLCSLRMKIFSRCCRKIFSLHYRRMICEVCRC